MHADGHPGRGMEHRMQTPRPEGVPDGDRASPDRDDPVLQALDQAREEYRRFRDGTERQVAELADTQAQEQAQAERQRERADRLAAAVRDIHRALFGGDVYSLILKACLTITGATRGLYITAHGRERSFRVRAAVDVDGYPQSPPSEFIRALCSIVLASNETFVANEEADWPDLPNPDPSEEFQNCVAAPVVLLRDLDGLLIVADKKGGPFDEDDAQALLAVGDEGAVAVENDRLRRELQGAYLGTITALAEAVEAKDPYTHGHCERVARYTRLVAERLGLSEHDRSVVYCAALLHDIGKIGVSDGVLNKPGPLLPEERELVRSHVRVGYDLICNIPLLRTVADVILRHHEWYDGTGYPEGLKGEEIPMTSRILCATDAYGAMIDKRSYKEAYTKERARDELRRCSGTQFDPKVVEAFLAVLDTPEAHAPDDVGWDMISLFGDRPEARAHS